MAIPRTQYGPAPTDAGLIPWAPGMDYPAAIDLVDQLAEGESVQNPATALWLLRADGEADHVDKSDLKVGGPTINGTVVMQRLAGLARGRYYRLFVTHGSSGNRRSASAVIKVGDTGTG